MESILFNKLSVVADMESILFNKDPVTVVKDDIFGDTITPPAVSVPPIVIVDVELPLIFPEAVMWVKDSNCFTSFPEPEP